MAIFSTVPPPEQQAAVEAWSVGSAVGTGVTLSIPLEKEEKLGVKARGSKEKEPLKRDSMNRRDALLKGKEGSRRRQRWENGRSYHCCYL